MNIHGVYGHEINHLFLDDDDKIWNEQGTLELDTTNYGGDVPATFTYGGEVPVVGNPDPHWSDQEEVSTVLSWSTFRRLSERLRKDEHHHICLS